MVGRKQTVKFPKTLGACVDKAYTLRAERLELQNKVKELKEQEAQLTEHLIKNIKKSNATGVAGKLARATVNTKDVPAVKDWKKVYRYISQTKSWDLLGRSMNSAAWRERIESGKKVPGVEPFTTVSVSLTKC